ncbi:hypothetical protein [Allonocardiopsis opalescens]|uniref:Magnesium transporter NIPA n=1 Tax=Allonocardiopsis opalescens TaxID=1144618 RepID=A0A2T0QCJ4_9ACTN|nr:hypothetical protein [Allonocardiopsis opalescens]PRY01573.1 hypothetical protein CLV72_101156 [Allonocardiopsis opalescens]
MSGLLTALAAAAVYSLGLLLEQRALRRIPDISARRVPHMVRVLLGSRGWLGGFALAALGSLGLVVALSLAPVSVVQPAYACGIAVMILVYSVLLGERISRAERLALLLMPVALLLLGLSLGSGGDRVGTRPDLPLLLAVSALTVLGCAAALAALAALRRSRTASAAATGTVVTTAVGLGAAAGLVQGMAGLHGKGMGGLLAEHGAAAAVPAVLASPYPYLYAVGWAIGIVLFQTSLQRSRASVTAPVANVVGNVFTVVAGTVIFAEQLPGDPLALGLRIAGFALTLVVVLLVRSSVSEAEADTRRLRGAAAVPEGAERG